MFRRLDEARDLVHNMEDRQERAFLRVALNTAWLDMRAGARDETFDYVTFIEVMRKLYTKRLLLRDVLDGDYEKHLWWPEDD